MRFLSALLLSLPIGGSFPISADILYSVTDLSRLGFLGRDANEAGQVAGSLGSDAGLYSNGQVKYLGTLGGCCGASYGINVANVGTLNVSDCVIQGFTFIGVNFTSGSPASLLMTRCKLRNCSNNALVAGVNGVALTTTFEGCQFESCGEGITTYFSTKVMAHDCVAARNYTGFSVSNGASGVLLACTAANNKNTGVNGAGGTLTLQGCAIFNNPTGVDAGVSGQISLLNCSISSNNVGINADGGGAAVRLDACAITDNATAYNISNSQAATISSRGNNTVAHNTATGSIGTYAPQ